MFLSYPIFLQGFLCVGGHSPNDPVCSLVRDLGTTFNEPEYPVEKDDVITFIDSAT